MRNKPIQIWYIIGSLKVGGANRTLIDLANNLNPRYFDVTIYTILDTNPLASELNNDIELRTLDASSKTDFPVIFQFVYELRRSQPKILQSFCFYDNILARIGGAASPGTSIISGVRAVPENPNRIREIADKKTMPLSDYVVSNSEAGRQLAISRGAEPASTYVVENGRDLEAYKSATASKNIRHSFKIPLDATVVGTVGRLIERKGHYDLMKAWSKVHTKHPNSYLLMVGDGPEREGLEEMAANYGCSDSVIFAGTRSDVPELLDAMDIFVFPSHFEGLPGALIEAMAAGLPIVATSANGNSELITDGETGLLTPVQNPSALANRISILIEDDKLSCTLGERATTEAIERFSLSKMVSEFSSIYRDIIQP